MWRRRQPAPWLLRALVAMTFSGWVATLAGWYVTEIGRQTWLVSGVLRTAEAASAVPAPMIGVTLVAYLAVYAVLIAAYIAALLHLARKGGEVAARRRAGAAPLAVPKALAAE